MTTWTRSTRCDSNACAEVWPGSRTVWVRASGEPGTVLSVDRPDWRELLAEIRAGGLDR